MRKWNDLTDAWLCLQCGTVKSREMAPPHAYLDDCCCDPILVTSAIGFLTYTNIRVDHDLVDGSVCPKGRNPECVKDAEFWGSILGKTYPEISMYLNRRLRNVEDELKRKDRIKSRLMEALHLGEGGDLPGVLRGVRNALDDLDVFE